MITEPRKLNEEEELALKKIFEYYKKTFIEPREKQQTLEDLLLFFCIALLLVVVSGTAYWVYETLGKI